MINVVDGIKVRKNSLPVHFYILTSSALVTRTGNQPDDGPRLKTAAHLAASGDLQETAEKIWSSDGSRLDEHSIEV